MARKFVIRTFGCQMNEHDSERLAGLLVADGLEPTDDLAEADVVVLNTCCIRENADNKLYGHLGHLKALQERQPGMQIAVGGCLAQKDRELVRRKAGHVDVVFGTHNLARAPELLRRAAAERPGGRDPRRPRPGRGDRRTRRPLSAVRELPYAAWVTIQTGCDNSCAFCIVPSVRGPEVSRPVGDLVAEVADAGRAGRGRGHPARPERELLRARPDRGAGRSSPTCCGPWARWRGSAGCASPARTPRTCAPRRSPPWPRRRRSATSSTCRCSRGATGCWPPCAAATRPSATSTGWRRPGRPIADLAVTTDIIVGFPGETEDDFEPTLAVVAEAGYDSAYTFIFSPRPGTRAAAMEDRFVPAEVVAERFERLRVVVERSALARHRARVGRHRGGAGRGAQPAGPLGAAPGGPARASWCTSRPAGPERSARRWPAPGSFAEVEVTGAAPHHLTGTPAGG